MPESSRSRAASRGHGSVQNTPVNDHLDISFECTVKNEAPPPCGLNDFMDYLFYVERRAENLQFFLWYCDYVERWSRLLPRQRRLAPAWGPAEAAEAAHADADAAAQGAAPRGLSLEEPRSATLAPAYHRRGFSEGSTNLGRPKLRVDTGVSTRITSPPAVAPTSGLGRRSTRRVAAAIHQRSDSEKLTNILAILEDEEDAGEARQSLDLDRASSADAPPEEGLPYTLQPFRDEVARIVRHYVVATGPRALPDLFAPERAACLRAARRTTHPSALLPVFLATESVLRTESFPEFSQRWRVANVYGARLVVGRSAAVALFLAGVVLDVLLIVLMPAQNSADFPRLACLVLWWPALASLLASRRGIDLVLFAQRRRLLRPWEMEADWGEAEAGVEMEAYETASPASTYSEDSEKGLPLQHHHNQNQNQSHNHKHYNHHHHHSRQHFASTSSAVLPTINRLDPLRKPSLQPLGPRNNPDAEPWAVWAAHAPLYRRLLEPFWPATAVTRRTVAMEHPGVRTLQSRAVLIAVLSSGLASAVLTVGSLFIPGPHR